MRFFGIEEKDGLVRIPGPMSMEGSVSMSGSVSAPNLDYTEIAALVDALALKLNASAYTAADVLAKLLTVDGPGSLLNADLLDGLDSTAFLSAATYTAADVLAKLLTVDGAGSGLDADLLDGNSSAAFVLAATYTAADVLAKLLTVDGTGSGLDADLLDGLSTAAYAKLATAEVIAAAWNFTTRQQVFGTTTANIGLVTGLGDTGVSIHCVEQLRTHRVAAEPVLGVVRVNGSYAVPTTLVSGNSAGAIAFGGYDGTTIQSQSALIFYDITETWSGSARGGQLRFQVTTTGTTTRADRLILSGTGATVPGNLTLSTAGNKLLIKEGSNASMGASTLVAGTVTVSNTLVTANSRIFLSIQSLGTVTAPKAIGVTARVAGTSFTITSADATDTSVIAWHITEPA